MNIQLDVLETLTEKDFEKILSTEMQGAFEGLTVRDGLVKILSNFWTMGADFTPGTPTGVDSFEWEDDFYQALSTTGYLDVEEDGEYDVDEAYALMKKTIAHL